MIDIESVAENGLLTETFDDSVDYDYRALIAYAREQGKDTSELTDEELKMFRI